MTPFFTAKSEEWITCDHFELAQLASRGDSRGAGSQVHRRSVADHVPRCVRHWHRESWQHRRSEKNHGLFVAMTSGFLYGISRTVVSICSIFTGDHLDSRT
jgi:hypothetical protein